VTDVSSGNKKTPARMVVSKVNVWTIVVSPVCADDLLGIKVVSMTTDINIKSECFVNWFMGCGVLNMECRIWNVECGM